MTRAELLDRRVSPQTVVDLLNELVKLDADAVSRLVGARVPCNEAIQQHPTVQVGWHDNEWQVGLLGLLNGLFGVDDTGQGPIVMTHVAGRVVDFSVQETEG